jgi:tetratricopeptide (TPR) repeat protein
VRRVLGWYLHSVVAVARVISPHGNQVDPGELEPGVEPLRFASLDEALDWCEGERTNLVAATRQAAAMGLHDMAWKLPVAALGFFNRRTYWTEWVVTHQIALNSARQVGDKRAEAWVLNNLGMAYLGQGQEVGVDYFRQALAIRRDIGDQTGEAQAANNLAYACLLVKRFDEALEMLYLALDLQRTLGHRFGEGIALNNLGEASLELGRPDEAVDWLRQALEVYREIGASTEEGDTLRHLGKASADRGRIPDALDYLRQAEQTYRTVGHRYGEGLALLLLGDVYLQDQHTADAAQAWHRAQSIFETLGNEPRAQEARERVAALPG